MLNKRGDRDYSKDAELLKNSDFYEYKAAVGSSSSSNLTTCSCLRSRKLLFVPAPSHLVRKCQYLQ